MKTIVSLTVLSYLIFIIIGTIFCDLRGGGGTITIVAVYIALILFVDMFLTILLSRWIKNINILIILFVVTYELFFIDRFNYITDKNIDTRNLNICYVFPVLISTIIILLYININKKRKSSRENI